MRTSILLLVRTLRKLDKKSSEIEKKSKMIVVRYIYFKLQWSVTWVIGYLCSVKKTATLGLKSAVIYLRSVRKTVILGLKSAVIYLRSVRKTVILGLKSAVIYLRSVKNNATLGLKSNIIHTIQNNRGNIYEYFPNFNFIIYGKKGRYLFMARFIVPLRLYRLFLNYAILASIYRNIIGGDSVNLQRDLRLICLLMPRTILMGNNEFSYSYIDANFRSRNYKTISRKFTEDGHKYSLTQLYMIAESNLYCMRLNRAEELFAIYLRRSSKNYNAYRMMATIMVLRGNVKAGLRYFNRTFTMYPNYIMSHQNYAGRYNIQKYKPQPWETINPGLHMVYDNLNRLAEEMFLSGEYKASFDVYTQMLNWQKKRRDFYPLPNELITDLMAYSTYDSGKVNLLLSYEWVVQFGHIGLLDSFLKMARLGMYEDANYIVLAPSEKIANRDYLELWEKCFIVVYDDALVNKLFPYQRYWGVNFMCWLNEEGYAESWTKMAAIAQAKWADLDRPPLITLSGKQLAEGRVTLKKMGIGPSDWFVNLHVRESGYHKEGAMGNASSHRNANVETYLDGVREITKRGGYVIRLGDSSMRRLPKMDRVIDYPHTPFKSSMMDLFLLAEARFTIGTTSGLTTACISFGSPMLLLNCISNDWQLWPKTVNFALKKIWDFRKQRYLSIRETLCMPTQGWLINSMIMRLHGIEAHSCTEDEIKKAIKDMMCLVEGEILDEKMLADPIYEAFSRNLLDNPYAFGNARPILSFYRSNPELLI